MREHCADLVCLGRSDGCLFFRCLGANEALVGFELDNIAKKIDWVAALSFKLYVSEGEMNHARGDDKL